VARCPLYIYSILRWVLLGIVVAGGIYLFYFRRRAVLATYCHLIIRLVCHTILVVSSKNFTVEQFESKESHRTLIIKNIEIIIPKPSPDLSDAETLKYLTVKERDIKNRIKYWASQLVLDQGSLTAVEKELKKYQDASEAKQQQ
jgi:hypothetical protein